MKKFFFVVCLLASVSAMFAQKQHGRSLCAISKTWYCRV